MGGYRWKLHPIVERKGLFWMYRGKLEDSGYNSSDKTGIKKKERER